MEAEHTAVLLEHLSNIKYRQGVHNSGTVNAFNTKEIHSILKQVKYRQGMYNGGTVNAFNTKQTYSILRQVKYRQGAQWWYCECL